jgi:uncharacterized protein (TIGR02453 family)
MIYLSDILKMSDTPPPPKTMLQQSTVNFIKALKKNNNKAWFDEHRKQYEAAKQDFEGLVQKLIDAHARQDSSIVDLKAKACIYRINRDVRFSKDKSPYKSNFGAGINGAGKKSVTAGYYVQIEPGKSFVGGGLYMPMPPDLKKVRQEIDYNWEEFKSIINNKKFKAVYGKLSDGEEMKLTRVPQGFDKDAAAAEFLKYKSFVALKPLTDEELTEKNLVKKMAEAFTVLQPLMNFLNRSFD